MRTPSPTERSDIHRESPPPLVHASASENSVAQIAKRAIALPSFEDTRSPDRKVRRISSSPCSFSGNISSEDFITKTPEKAFEKFPFGHTSDNDCELLSEQDDDDFVAKPAPFKISAYSVSSTGNISSEDSATKIPETAFPSLSFGPEDGSVAKEKAPVFSMFGSSRGKPAPKEIVTGPIPLDETANIDNWHFNKKTYLKARNDVQKEWEITSQSGVEVPLQRRAIGEGNYAMSYLLQEGAENFYQDVENGKIICKMYKDSTSRGEAVYHKEALFYSIRQYKALEQDFTDLTEESKPYAKIYNAETVATDGYVLQEKVIPLGQKPTWNKDTRIEDLPEKDRGILEQIKTLFHYSYCKQVQNPNWKDDTAISSSSKDTYVSPKTISAPGLDLWIPNLGIREGTDTVVIFDFREDDDLFPIHACQHLRNLSNGNIAIRDYLLAGLEEKVRGNASLEFDYRYLIDNLKG